MHRLQSAQNEFSPFIEVARTLLEKYGMRCRWIDPSDKNIGLETGSNWIPKDSPKGLAVEPKYFRMAKLPSGRQSEELIRKVTNSDYIVGKAYALAFADFKMDKLGDVITPNGTTLKTEAIDPFSPNEEVIIFYTLRFFA